MSETKKIERDPKTGKIIPRTEEATVETTESPEERMQQDAGFRQIKR